MKRIWIGFLLIFLSACQPVSVETQSPTATVTLTPSPSATVDWFPPTFTPELSATTEITPTPGIMSELGEIIFRDDFISPDGWTVSQSDRGQISIANGEINIIINESGTLFVGTLEKPDLRDFYAEITANPILCSPDDEYGFLFRVSGRNQYYRFVLSCDGEVRLDKIIGKNGTILYPWTRSASVPVGAPSVSKLAVLAVGDQIHVFINGDPQFTIQDRELKVGSFGVYARSVGDNAVTVSFSNLIVRDVLPKQ
ncbi:MAG: hypothetical protein MUP11_13485 [Anaerolineales bacterium]|nr:hypothetical protein [Anaerolineales bacterium]